MNLPFSYAIFASIKFSSFRYNFIDKTYGGIINYIYNVRSFYTYE